MNKLFNILDDQRLLNNTKFQIKIKKNNTSTSWSWWRLYECSKYSYFLIKRKFLKLSKKKILEITNLIGSDVILGITPNNTVLSSNNIIKKFSRGPNFHTLLIRPNFGCSTKKIYSGVKNFSKPILNNPRKNMMNLKSLLRYKNDLEKIAFTKYPKLKILKSFLENLNQPLFVRMTGSGSVIVAYYQKNKIAN